MREALIHGAYVAGVGGVEAVEQRSKEPFERALLVAAEDLEQPPLVLEVGLQRPVDHPLALPREPHEGATTIVGIGQAFDQPRFRQAVQPLGGASRREQGRLRQPSWG